MGQKGSGCTALPALALVKGWIVAAARQRRQALGLPRPADKLSLSPAYPAGSWPRFVFAFGEGGQQRVGFGEDLGRAGGDHSPLNVSRNWAASDFSREMYSVVSSYWARSSAA